MVHSRLRPKPTKVLCSRLRGSAEEIAERGSPVTSERELRKRLKFQGAKRPQAQKLKGRKTTINNAFVLSILPVIEPTDEDIQQALEVLGQDPGDVRCVYCGAPSHGWDHLRPVVRNSFPTGFITEIANLVPACGKCNSSKAGADWRAWMTSTTAQGSPTSRGIPDIAERIAKLEAFEVWRKPTHIEFEKIISKNDWDAYWRSRDAIIEKMLRCQEAADRILSDVMQTLPKQ